LTCKQKKKVVERFEKEPKVILKDVSGKSEAARFTSADIVIASTEKKR
jgi:hypothetical protein